MKTYCIKSVCATAKLMKRVNAVMLTKTLVILTRKFNKKNWSCLQNTPPPPQSLSIRHAISLSAGQILCAVQTNHYLIQAMYISIFKSLHSVSISDFNSFRIWVFSHAEKRIIIPQKRTMQPVSYKGNFRVVAHLKLHLG